MRLNRAQAYVRSKSRVLPSTWHVRSSGLFCALLLCSLVLLATIPQSPFYIPEAYGAVTYTWNDTVSTVTLSGSGTVTFTNLRTQDRAASASHTLLSNAVFDAITTSSSLTYQVRPLDDVALRLKVVVSILNVNGNLTLTGVDWKGTALSETINILAITTYQTTGYFRSINSNGVTSDGILDATLSIKQDRWGIIGVGQFPLSTSLWIWQGGINASSGVTLTIPASSLHLRLASASELAIRPSYYLQVNSGATTNFGTLVDATTKAVTNGAGIVITASGTSSGNSFLNNGGTMNFYATEVSTFNRDNLISQTGSTTRIYGCLFNNLQLVGVGYDVYNFFQDFPSGNTAYAFNSSTQAFSGTFNKISVTKAQTLLYISPSTGNNVTLSNLYSRNSTYTLVAQFPNIPYSVFLVDPDIDTWNIASAITWTGRLYRQYTINLQTTYLNETPYSGANVTITYYGEGGGTVGSWLTNGNGNIPEQILSSGYYDQAHGDVIQSYNPYHLAVTSSDMQTISTNFTVMDTLDWRLPLKFNFAPVARFGYSPLNPQPSQMVTFDGSLSTDRDGSISSYSWNFGDLQTGVGSSVQHAYATAGTYTVTLTVTDNQVSTDGFSQSVYVESVSVGGGQNVGLNVAPNFDINILKMVSYTVTLPVWQRTFTMQTTVHNKGSFQQEVTLSYWLTVEGKSSKVWEGSQSFLMQSKETRPVDIEYPIPSESGNYTAYSKVTFPSGSEGSLVQQSFIVYNVVGWLLTEGLLFLVLSIAIPTVVFCGWATKEEKWSEWLE